MNYILINKNNQIKSLRKHNKKAIFFQICKIYFSFKKVYLFFSKLKV